MCRGSSAGSYTKLLGQARSDSDGRKAGFRLADRRRRIQGREKSDHCLYIITNQMESTGKAIGGLVQNVRFSKNALRNEQDLMASETLSKLYMRAADLRYRSTCLVQTCSKMHSNIQKITPICLSRVAGYSDYFVHLNPNMGGGRQKLSHGTKSMSCVE